MKTKLILPLLIITLLFSSNVFAFDESGEYVIGGGVGSIPCKMYNPVLTRARLAGGINSPAGAKIINGYMNYVLGFQTGHNVSHEGGRDIFEKFGETPTNKLLPLIAKWCKENPEENFGNAVVAVTNDSFNSGQDDPSQEDEEDKDKFLFSF